MELSYLTFTSMEGSPIVLKNPLINLRKGFDVNSCCEYLISYQTKEPSNHSKEVQHWWNHKWQVSLDYYLSSSAESRQLSPRPDESVNFAVSKQARKEPPISSVEALLTRKTHRKFEDLPLAANKFIELLEALRDEIFKGIWNYYIVIFNVRDFLPGIYSYSAQRPMPSLIKPGLFRNEAIHSLCGMSASLTASFLLVLCIDLQQALSQFPYNRALREIYIDSGRLAQKLIVRGMQHGVGGLPSPAMRDSDMCSLLGIKPSQCIPIYTITMGNIPKHAVDSLLTSKNDVE